MSDIFDIQCFAEEAENMTGAKESPDAGETREADKPTFDELIADEYREEYGKRVEEIVKKRLSDHAELKKNSESLTRSITELGESLGIESSKPDEIISAIKEQLADRSDTADTADAQGAEPDDNEGGEADKEEHKALLARLVRGCEMTREYYPQFDIRRELTDPRFRALLRLTGNDPKKSFEILHHDEILASAVRDAARLAEERLAGSIASKAHRPSEGAETAVASIYIDRTPSSLSRKEREDIKKRVRRGERVTW